MSFASLVIGVLNADEIATRQWRHLRDGDARVPFVFAGFKTTYVDKYIDYLHICLRSLTVKTQRYKLIKG